MNVAFIKPKEIYEAGKVAKRIRRQVGEAIADFGMIEQGDKVMVCLSGGKDSHALLDVLLSLQEKSPVKFELIAVNLDQKQPGFPAHVLPEYLTGRGVAFRIVEQDTYSVVKRVIPEGKTMCLPSSETSFGGIAFSLPPWNRLRKKVARMSSRWCPRAIFVAPSSDATR